MTRPGEDTRSRLREIARDLYIDLGPQGFSLREVARRAGLSAAAVYRHFDGKEALLRDVCTEGLRIFGSFLVQSLEAETPRKRLSKAGELYLRFGLAHPRDYRVIFMSSNEETAAKEQSSSTATTFLFLVDRVEECMRAKVLKRGDAKRVAVTIWAHVHGLTSLRISGQLSELGDEPTFMRFYLASVEQLIDGLSR